jgi:hypothetical protein
MWKMDDSNTLGEYIVKILGKNWDILKLEVYIIVFYAKNLY